MAVQFDPIGGFQGARSNALAIQGQEQNLALQPKRNALADLKLSQAKTQGQRQTTQFNQQQGLVKGKFMLNAADALKRLPLEARNQAAQRLLPQAEQLGIDANQIDLSQPLTDDVLDNVALQSNAAIQALSTAPDASAAQREFDSLMSGLTDEQKRNAKLVKLGLKGRATGSAAQTIADEGTAESIAASEGLIAGGKEAGKLEKQLIFKPQIAKAVKLAESEAKARGETLTDLKRSEAALPGLLDAVSQLKELAPIATSTLGGRAFDIAIKESGFGSTKGADARAKFIAIINNQVLPLLKPTFGGSFTVQEGEALKATMGDPNATPTQKIEQLNAFIDQKTRNIQAKKTEVSTGDLTTLSDDDLLSF